MVALTIPVEVWKVAIESERQASAITLLLHRSGELDEGVRPLLVEEPAIVDEPARLFRIAQSAHRSDAALLDGGNARLGRVLWIPLDQPLAVGFHKHRAVVRVVDGVPVVPLAIDARRNMDTQDVVGIASLAQVPNQPAQRLGAIAAPTLRGEARVPRAAHAMTSPGGLVEVAGDLIRVGIHP